MSCKSPRYIPSNSLIEITARTVGARYLLRPSPQLTACILGIIGRALALFPVELHAFAFLSNHWHALITAADALAARMFIQHVHSNVARAANRLHGWSGPVFRKSSMTVVAPDAEEARLRYVLSQGAKEGLVASPVMWPGAHCARALAGEETLHGVWRDRSYEARLRTPKGGRQASAAELETRYEIALAPLPTWRSFSENQRRDRVRAMIREIETAARERHSRPLGVRAVLAQDPMGQPRESKCSTAPLIHTGSAEERAHFLMLRRVFELEFRAARDTMRSGQPARLPAGCFPPTAPFQAHSAVMWMATSQPLRTPVPDSQHTPRSLGLPVLVSRSC